MAVTEDDGTAQLFRDIRQLVIAGDRQQLCQFLAPLDETQRTRLAEPALAMYRCISEYAGPGGVDRRRDVDPLSADDEALLQALSGQKYVDWRVPRWCAGLVVFAVCNQKTLSGYLGVWVETDNHSMPHRVLQVLNDRRPPWLQAYVRKQTQQKGSRIVSWSVERGLIRSGAIAASDDDDYVNRFAMGVPEYVSMRTADEVRTDSLSGLPESTSDVLLADPDLLKVVWRMFEVENSGLERSFYGWQESLKELAEQGRLDRLRLLKASLSALLLSTRPGVQSAFAKFHEFLEPTPAERAALFPDYLHLLAAGSTPAALAVAACEELAKAKQLNVMAFLESCHPVFRLDKKVLPNKVLKLIKRMIKEKPDCRDVAISVLVAGLNNVSPDVQEESLGLLETQSDQLTAATRSELRFLSESVAAALRSRIEKLAGKEVEPTVDSAVSPTSRLEDDRQETASSVSRMETFSPWLRKVTGVDAAFEAMSKRLEPIPPPIDSRLARRRDPAQAVIPLASVDELIDAVAAFVEGCDDAIEVERILDGISRFRRDKAEGFEQRVAPLKKRIEATSDEFTDTILATAVDTGVPQLIRAWLGLPPISRERGEWYDMPLRFFRNRTREISYRLIPNHSEKPALPLLSLPTHRGGWVDPVVLVERIAIYIQAQAIVSTNIDIALALLRLSPDGGEEAKQALAQLKADQGNDCWYMNNEINALEFALGEPVELSWRTAGLNFESRCLAAAHARVTRGHPCDPPLPFTVPNATLNDDGSIQFVGPITDDVAFPGGLMLQAHSWSAALPQWESWGNSGSARRNWMVEWQNIVWPNNRAAACLHSIQSSHVPQSLNNLLDPDWTWTDEACRLAAWAMGTENADCRMRMTDALVYGTSYRTFDPVHLGQHLVAIFERLKLNRVAAVLADAARVSPLHQWTVFTIVDSVLCQLAAAPRDLHHLLTVLLENAILIGHPVSEPSRRLLSSITGSSKTAKLAEQILAVSAAPDGMQRVQESALSASLDRAERWGSTWT